MIIDWIAATTQQLLLEQDVEPDELSENFDFALSAEIMALLRAKNESQQHGKIKKGALTRFGLDEHELALS
jgi:hypothetical protein